MAKDKPPSQPDGRLLALIARYEGAEDITLITANLDALEGTSRCACCRLAVENERVHAVMTAMLARKEKVEDIAAYLHLQGYSISVSMLSRHTREHLRPGLLNVAIKAGALERIAKQAFGVSSGDLATMTVRAMMVPLLDAMDDLEKGKTSKKYRAMLEADPVGFAQFAANMAKALSSIQRTNRQAEIMEAKIELERAKVRADYDKLIHRGFEALRGVLDVNDEGRAILKAIEKFVKADKP